MSAEIAYIHGGWVVAYNMCGDVCYDGTERDSHPIEGYTHIVTGEKAEGLVLLHRQTELLERNER